MRRNANLFGRRRMSGRGRGVVESGRLWGRLVSTEMVRTVGRREGIADEGGSCAGVCGERECDQGGWVGTEGSIKLIAKLS